ncbi:hypothetical protein BH23VER1_BH23VER1_07610 [soil metagenome]
MLVPPLPALAEIDPDGFEVAGVDDQGVAVLQVDADDPENAVVSERLWNVALTAAPGLAEPPTSFRFPVAKVETKEIHYQRYDDADLASAAQEIALLASYEDGSRPGLWAGAAGLALLLGAGTFLFFRPRRQAAPVPVPRHGLPATVDPFTVITLLRRLRDDPDLELADGERADLSAAIAGLERRHFGGGDGDGMGADDDLQRLAEDWLRRAA